MPAITAPGAFDNVVKSEPSTDVVIHIALPFLYKAVSDNLKGFLILAKQDTEEILKAIKAHASSVRRVAVTSSCAAVLDFAAGHNGRRYTANDWNPSTWEEAVKGDKGVGYRASKKYAERAGQFEILCLNLFFGTSRRVIPSMGLRGT